MFTGLIQGIGTIERLGSEHLSINCGASAAGLILPDLAIGDSVAVDGVCLTVTEIREQGFVAVASPETLRRTTLGTAQTRQTYVNLETSLRVGSKIGGHFVTGHVDGVGHLQSAISTASSWEITFSVSTERLARYIIPKGSIAVNGISLTVAECDQAGSWFKVAVIPHTYVETNLQYLEPGAPVNLEGDILGKYVEKFLNPYRNSEQLTNPEITLAFLAEHGFM